MSTLAYVRGMLSQLLRSKMLFGCWLLLSAFMAAPLLTPGASTGGADILARYSTETLNSTRTLETSLVESQAPEELIDIIRNQVRALEAATTATDDNAFFEAAADYERASIRLREKGYLSSGEDPALKANAETILRLADLEEPEVYQTVAEEPSLYYLASQIAMIPPLLWALPTVLATTLAIKARDRNTLLSQAPVARPVPASTATLTGGLTGFLTCLASLLPAGLFALGANGIGDPSYPVAFIRNGELVSTTLSVGLAATTALWLLQCIFMATLASLVFEMARRIDVSLLVLASYLAAGEVLGTSGALVSWLPMTYLRPYLLTGYPTYFNGADLFPVAGASVARSAIVLGVGIVLLLAATCLARQLRRGRCI